MWVFRGISDAQNTHIQQSLLLGVLDASLVSRPDPMVKLRKILGKEGVQELWGRSQKVGVTLQPIKFKSLKNQEKKSLKRRQAIKPIIGHFLRLRQASGLG
jgi:hypothetical protein